MTLHEWSISYSVEMFDESGVTVDVALLTDYDKAVAFARDNAQHYAAVAIYIRADYPGGFDYADEPCYKLGIREVLARI